MMSWEFCLVHTSAESWSFPAHVGSGPDTRSGVPASRYRLADYQQIHVNIFQPFCITCEGMSRTWEGKKLRCQFVPRYHRAGEELSAQRVDRRKVRGHRIIGLPVGIFNGKIFRNQEPSILEI